MPGSSFASALADLRARSIDFVVVGGIAAVLDGAPVQTLDLGLVYSLEPENIDRLLTFLRDADAIFRMQPERRLRPGRTHLVAGGQLNLQTRFGPVDLLGSIGQNLGYPDLLPHSREFEVADMVSVRVLDLETIIAVKEYLNTDKDRAVLPVLRETLRRLKQRGLPGAAD